MLTSLVNLSTQRGRLEFCCHEIERIQDVCEILSSHLRLLGEETAAGNLVSLSEGLLRVERVLKEFDQQHPLSEWGLLMDLSAQASPLERLQYCQVECDSLRSLCEVLASHLQDRQEQAGYQVVQILSRSLQDVLAALALMRPDGSSLNESSRLEQGDPGGS